MDLTPIFLVACCCIVMSLCDPSLKDDKGGLFGLKPLSLDDLLKNKRHISSGHLPCICGVFRTSQIKDKNQPKGFPVLLHEQTEATCCGPLGVKACVNPCLDQVVKYLPKSADIMCAAIEDNCYRERAFLYIKNCEGKWTPTNMSAGREFCCVDNQPIKCAKMDQMRRHHSSEESSRSM